MTIRNGLFSSESVSEGHPDKLADRISDRVLDAFLERDPHVQHGGPGEHRGKIAAIDNAANTITIAPAPADPRGLVGRIIYVTNPARRVAVKVESARTTEKGVELALATDSRIGTGKVTGIDGRNILTDTRFYVGGFRYYHGARELVLLWIAPSHLSAKVRWEASVGKLFPHIYGPLNLEAVLVVTDFDADADGVFRTLKAP